MDFFNIFAILLTLAALFSYLNHRFLRLPPTIALMGLAMASSLLLILLDHLGLGLETRVETFVRSLDFNHLLLEGMLGFLLFAGALHVNLNDLMDRKWEISLLATLGVAGSTLLVGGGVYCLFAALGLGLPFIHCLVFGALISPTDPIAVMGILKTAGAPSSLKAKMSGESLFNDGIGVVVFVALIGLVKDTNRIDLGQLGIIFATEAAGGLVLGALIGLVAYWLLKDVDNYQVEVLITLAAAAGGYQLALFLHTSAPLAIVTAGLFIGNQGRRFAMGPDTRAHLDTFWELIDETLNALLFLLIGMETLVMTLSGRYLLAGLLAVPVVLAARFISVGAPLRLTPRSRELTPGAVQILTWGGLRGGISVALALSLPQGEGRDLILTVTYVVVSFSILVQGLSVKTLIKKRLEKA